MSDNDGSKPPRKSAWEILNSPLPLLIISGVVIAGGAQMYLDYKAAADDREARRATYVEILAEFEKRSWALALADGELDRFIGRGMNRDEVRKIPAQGSRRIEWERVSLSVGQKEADIIRGVGSYVPTSPSFAGVDLLTLVARLENTAGIPDVQLGSLRLMRGFLDSPPEILWLFVRAYLPMFQDFGVRRHMMYTNGEIPLARGAKLTRDQEQRLGFPDLKPGDLERRKAESDQLHSEIQNKLRGSAQ